MDEPRPNGLGALHYRLEVYARIWIVEQDPIGCVIVFRYYELQ
jgi:hypothetical protein